MKEFYVTFERVEQRRVKARSENEAIDLASDGRGELIQDETRHVRVEAVKESA
jgi:hypothetical protein